MSPIMISVPLALFITSTLSSTHVVLCHFLSCTIPPWASVSGRWGRAVLRITWRRASQRCTTTWGASTSPPPQKAYTCWSKTQTHTCAQCTFLKIPNLHQNAIQAETTRSRLCVLSVVCQYSVHLFFMRTVHNNSVRHQEQTWQIYSHHRQF